MTKITDSELETITDQVLDRIAENVNAEMRKKIPERDRVKALSKRTGLGRGTIQRVLSGSKGYAGQKRSAARVDTLVAIAYELGVPLVSLFGANRRGAVVLESAADEGLVRDLKSGRG